MSAPLYIGLMCGTSLDAIDIALISVGSRCTLVAADEAPLPSDLRSALMALCSPGDNEIERMGHADRQLALALAQAVNNFLSCHRIAHRDITAIGSHGQTIRHRPAGGDRPPNEAFTLQIGDAHTLAEHTGITTVADFRRRDLAAGGQGAPLVPAFHAAAFGKAGQDRVIANIGGMANLSILRGNGEVGGFDTGPGNIWMDTWIQHCRKQPFDRNGDWARSGRVNTDLLNSLLSDPYYRRRGPKSTGREHYHLGALKDALGNFPALAPADIQATLLELTATTLSRAILEAQLDRAEVYLCGGGALNGRLCQRLQEELPGATLNSTDTLGIPANSVEAAAFAWLAHATLTGLPGNAPAATGAQGERILGAIHPGGTQLKV